MIKTRHLRFSRLEVPLAVVAGHEHLDEHGLGSIVGAHYGVVADEVVCAERLQRHPPEDILPLNRHLVPPVLGLQNRRPLESAQNINY
jgi:hypothetical protein